MLFLIQFRKEIIYKYTEKLSELCIKDDTGWFFLLVPPQKVLSVEDGKIPTKKVKVGLFNSKMLSFNSDFHFFGRDLPSSTLFGAEPVKKITLYFDHIFMYVSLIKKY